MAKKSRNTADDASHGRARAVGAARSAAGAVGLPRHGDTIRPALALSDLQSVRELGESLSKHQDNLTEVVKNSGFGETPVAYQNAVDQVRASLRLPMEQLALQASEDAAVVPGRFTDLQNARDLARAAASAAPAAHRQRVPALPPSPPGRTDDNPPATIATVRDLGRLVREARERRKLSQQAFADLVGVGRRFISELENGKPSLELGKVLQVASATGIDVLARHRR